MNKNFVVFKCLTKIDQCYLFQILMAFNGIKFMD